MSVSDVVEIVGGKDAGFYFCDSIGFQRVEFEPERMQKLDTGMLRVVLVEPGKAARVAEINGSLEGMQKTVGGYIQAVYPFEETVCLVCNEEGKLQGLPLNRSPCGMMTIASMILWREPFLCAIAVRRTSRV